MLPIYLQWEWKLGKKSQVKFGNPMGSVMRQGIFSVLHQWPDITHVTSPCYTGWNSSSAEVTSRFLAGFTQTTMLQCAKGCPARAVTPWIHLTVLLYPHHPHPALVPELVLLKYSRITFLGKPSYLHLIPILPSIANPGVFPVFWDFRTI